MFGWIIFITICRENKVKLVPIGSRCYLRCRGHTLEFPFVKMLSIGTVPTTKIQPVMTVRTVITDLVELYLQDMNVNDPASSFNLQGQDV